ncbi:uncharacterized protein FTOL_09029 [Fusarium torulosum]|uniref:Uncharacterized protein n=1 Tax=Fusarium torulosum TaxID=33205 RepID=A0AAE8MF67_9HYPO|nr:uncharacterized protein FTOL_09029 [Fusarium torulosum]
MGTAVDPQTWIEIDGLISKALDAREKYRQGPQNQRTMAATWKPIMRLLSKFPEGTFTTYDYDTMTNIDPYSEEVLTTFTEIIWAFSSGPILNELDCPQIATDYYSYYTRDLCQIWYRSEPSDHSTWANLFRKVTNNIANYKLITTDTTSRPGLVNSPRAAMAAHAWIVTNSMCDSSPDSHAIAVRARQLWEDRCGHFVEIEN